MVKPLRSGKYPVQIYLSRDEYEYLRKMAYEKDKTVNSLVKELALAEFPKKE